MNVTDMNDDLIIKVKSEKLSGFCPVKISSLRDNYLYPGVGFQVFKGDEAPIGKVFIRSEFKPN